MKETTEMPDVDPEIPQNAVRVIDNASDEFPILKAFQQYVDAEQSKARKRMLALSIFFGALLTTVIIVFLILLNNVSRQNQLLNDRVFDYMIKERDRQAAAVVVQPPADNTMLLAKIDAMQKKFEESSQKAAEALAQAEVERKAAAEEAAKKAAELAAKPKGPTPEEEEIARLKALLASERQKAEAEREQRRQEELEAYRRKHYPDFYKDKKPTPKEPEIPVESRLPQEDSDLENLLKDLDDNNAIDYFGTDEETDSSPSPKTVKTPTYSIPVEVNGSSRSWRIPE